MKKLLLPVLLLGAVLSFVACGDKVLNQTNTGNGQDVGTHQNSNESKPTENPVVNQVKTNNSEVKTDSSLVKDKVDEKMSASLEYEGTKININCPTKYGNSFYKSSSGSNGSVGNDKYRVAMFVNKTSISDYFSTKVDNTYKYMQENSQKYSKLKASKQKTIVRDNGIKITYKKLNYVNEGALGTYIKEDIYAITEIGNGFVYEVEITGTGSTVSESMIKEFMDFTVSK